MYNYYLLNSAYEGIGKDRFLSNMEQLLEVLNNDDKYDHYYYSEQWWDVVVEESPRLKISTASMSCNQHFARMVLPRMMQKFKYCELIEDKAGLDEHFKCKNNAFWGEQFSLKENYCLSTKDDYIQFREATKLNYINFQNLLDYQSLLFKHIKFCSKAEHEMRNLGVSYVFAPVIDCLATLDIVNTEWVNSKGDFFKIASSQGLIITGEGETVRNNPKMQLDRTYNIPNIKDPQFVQFHVKIQDINGKIRIYIYIDWENQIVYVCEIGRHKATAKY